MYICLFVFARGPCVYMCVKLPFHMIYASEKELLNLAPFFVYLSSAQTGPSSLQNHNRSTHFSEDCRYTHPHTDLCTCSHYDDLKFPSFIGPAFTTKIQFYHSFSCSKSCGCNSDRTTLLHEQTSHKLFCYSLLCIV